MSYASTTAPTYTGHADPAGQLLALAGALLALAWLPARSGKDQI
jgi:hypothetical protein